MMFTQQWENIMFQINKVHFVLNAQTEFSLKRNQCGHNYELLFFYFFLFHLFMIEEIMIVLRNQTWTMSLGEF